MNEIRQILKLAATRLNLTTLLGKVHMVGIVVGALALATMLANRVPAEPFVPWIWVAPALAVAGSLIVLGLWLRRRPAELHVALEVDDRLDLREKLSTALHCRGRDDAFAQAAVEDAVNVARDPKTRERVRRTFAVQAPRGWWVSPLLIVLALVVSWVPQFNLFARVQDTTPEVKTTALEVQKSVDAVVKQITEDSKLKENLSDLLGELSTEPLSGQKIDSPEQLKRDAIKKVSEINKRLEEILNGEQGKTSEILKKTLEQLKTPQDGPAKEFSEALANGDFKAAEQALKQLMDKAANGKLDEKQLQQAAEQLQDIAKQMEQLAKQQDKLQEALKQAGMDPQLAANPQALQQAIQQNKNLNDQQKQQLQQMAQAQQQAQQMCQGMCKGLGQMGQAMQQGQMGQAGQQAGQMQQMLNDMEGMQQMLKAAQAASNQCKGQCKGLGEGLGQQQMWQQAQSQGGMGPNPGQGQGGEVTKQKTPTKTKLEYDPGKTDPNGDIIFRQFVDGKQIVGTSTAKLESVVANVIEGEQEGLTEDQLPRKYQPAHKHYFGELEAMIKAAQASGGKAPATAPPATAPPASAPAPAPAPAPPQSKPAGS